MSTSSVVPVPSVQSPLAARRPFFFHAEDGIRGLTVTGVQTCALPIYIGKKILNGDFSLDVIMHRGAGAYICGEESALMESLEGRRGYPRLKPPFPAVIGLYGGPTEIGRASCRERVEISEGAVALKERP